MAKVNICNVVVLDNPSPFHNPFQFEITFECLEDLKEDLEWKIIYVGSAESEAHDQTLDTVLVGPLKGGKHKFVFQADCPDVSRIPLADAVGVTVVLLTCGYNTQEFIRVGYYVNNEYGDPELKETPPTTPDYSKLQRNILATCPRVTRFRIDWGDGDFAGNSENVAPSNSTESESNQMSEGFGSNIDQAKLDQFMAAAASTGSGHALMSGAGGDMLGCSTDSNMGPIRLQNALTNNGGLQAEESMDMC